MRLAVGLHEREAEVVGVGRPCLGPVPDVVGLQEMGAAAAREPAAPFTPASTCTTTVAPSYLLTHRGQPRRQDITASFFVSVAIIIMFIHTKKGQKWSRQQVLSLHPSRGLGSLTAGNSRRVVPSDIWTTGGGISDAPQKYRLPPHRDGLALRPRNGLGEPPVEPLGRPQEIAGKFVPSPLGSVGLLGSPFGIAGSPAAVRTWPFLVIGVPHKRADHQKSGDTGI
jgi:hypothetical protein